MFDAIFVREHSCKVIEDTPHLLNKGLCNMHESTKAYHILVIEFIVLPSKPKL